MKRHKTVPAFDPYLQREVEIVKRIQDTTDIFTIRLQFTDPVFHRYYSFQPGQFNMLYLYGVGEAAISIVADPNDYLFSHTIHAIGQVTKGLSQLQVGDRLGVRGPFGRGWPLEAAKGKDVIVLTGGLGCAPVVCSINHILAHFDQYRSLKIMHGIRYSDDLLFPERFRYWETMPKTEIMISASREHDVIWPWGTGRITEYIQSLKLDANNTVVMMCGPEGMMETAVLSFLKKRIAEEDLYLSLERNMKCGLGLCGHCQMGGLFICKDGPVFSYAEVKHIFGKAGF